MIADLKIWIERHELGPRQLHSLAQTLNTRRSNSAGVRKSFVASTKSGIREALSAARLVRAPNTVNMIFLFTGQGAQYADYGPRIAIFPQFICHFFARITKNPEKPWCFLESA